VTEPITMYSTEWCGHCRRLRKQLDEAGIEVTVVDVDHHAHHGAKIVAETGGFRIVPTLEVDGKLLVNPSIAEVKAALASRQNKHL
jgi:mycoredoxin